MVRLEIYILKHFLQYLKDLHSSMVRLEIAFNDYISTTGNVFTFQYG